MNQEQFDPQASHEDSADRIEPLIIAERNSQDDVTPSNEEIERLSQSLVSYASKHCLSLRNVRSIIKQLLTDERLIIFAQQLAGDITEEPVKVSDSKSGSKLTRSKRKETSARQDVYGGEMNTALLDISFSEQDTSSDEEYNPLVDLTKNGESRDISEIQEASSPSSLSSVALSFEQPFDDVDSVLQAQHTPCSSNPLSYTTHTEGPCHSQEGKSYSTRSRDNLRQKSLLELEAGLIAPGMLSESPEDLSNGVDSEAWRSWLASFLADSSGRSGSDSEDADYNFLQDIDKEINMTEKREEFRYDFQVRTLYYIKLTVYTILQVRVSQREILELVNSLVEEAGPWGILPDASEGSVCENECNYRTGVLGSERDNKLTLEVLESGAELTPQQKVYKQYNYKNCSKKGK